MVIPTETARITRIAPITSGLFVGALMGLLGGIVLALVASFTSQ